MDVSDGIRYTNEFKPRLNTLLLLSDLWLLFTQSGMRGRRYGPGRSLATVHHNMGQCVADIKRVMESQ